MGKLPIRRAKGMELHRDDYRQTGPNPPRARTEDPRLVARQEQPALLSSRLSRSAACRTVLQRLLHQERQRHYASKRLGDGKPDRQQSCLRKIPLFLTI